MNSVEDSNVRRNDEKRDLEDVLIEEAAARAPPKVKLLYVDSRVVEKMLRIFLASRIRGKEAIVLLTGRAEDEIAYLTTIWPLKVLRVSGTHIEPNHFWLYECIKAAVRLGHNVVVEAHRHPLGGSYSSLDRRSLGLMSDWLRPGGILYLIGCCEIEFAVYLEDDYGKVIQVPIVIWTPIKAVKGKLDVEKKPEIEKRVSLLSRLRSFLKGD